MFVMFVLAANVAQKTQWSGCIRHFQRGGFCTMDSSRHALYLLTAVQHSHM